VGEGAIEGVGIEVERVGVACRVGGDEAAEVGVIVASAKIDEAGFGVVGLGTEAPRELGGAFTKGGEDLV